jgi:hypothetical protein
MMTIPLIGSLPEMENQIGFSPGAQTLSVPPERRSFFLTINRRVKKSFFPGLAKGCLVLIRPYQRIVIFDDYFE